MTESTRVKTPPAFEDVRVHVRLKLAALWVSVMFCYLYGDFIGLYQPGKLQALLAGRMPLGPTSPRMLLGIAVVMAIPSLMVFLSLALRLPLVRWINIAVGAAYTALMLITLPGAPAFYLFLGLVEIALTTLIAALAWTWPRTRDLAEPIP